MLLNHRSASFPVFLFPGCHFFLILAGSLILSACGGDSDSPTTARTVPQNVTLTVGTRINEINWSGVNGANGYTVYWSTGPGVTPATGTAIDTRQPHLEHRGLANGTTYYYTVTSLTDFGQSTASAIVEGTPRATRPAAPGDLDLQPGNARITLRWDTVPGATHYTLYWKNSAGVTINDTRIDRVVSPFVHPGLENGQSYFYRLVANNAQGPSESSPEQNATPRTPSLMAPQITQADVTSGQVTLHWQHTGIASQYDLYWSTTDISGDTVTENATPLTQVTSPYTHAPLLDGQPYYYWVQARNSIGVSALSNFVQITPPGEEALIDEQGPVPATPTDLTVSLGNGQLSLNWSPVNGALGYNLYWTTDDTGEINADNARLTQIQSPYTHIQLNNGTRYRYRLSALNNHGESALSTEVNGTPQEIIPGVPADIQALAGDETILVRWNPVQNATGYTLTLNEQIFTEVSSPHRITGLTNAQPYSIQLQAQSAQGLSAFSAPVNATPREPTPNTPRQLTAQPGNAAILLQWTAATPQNANDPDEAITGYRIYYATRPGVRPDNSTLIDNATPTLNDDGRWQLRHLSLQNGQRYYYVVSAQNAGGEGRFSEEVWARPQAPASGIPGGLSAEAGDSQVLIEFIPPAPAPDTEPGAAPTPTYNLYWTEILNGRRSPTEVISNIEPGHRFTGINGTTYFFQVSAVNNGNESPLSNEISATPQIPAPAQAPQDAQTLTDNAQVTLSWTPVAEADRYVIYWSTEPDIDPQTSNRLSGDIQSGFVHDKLENGQSYFYRIAAVNAGGESALSALLAAQPQIPPPATPTDLTVQPGDGQVTINFELIATATHYRVFWHPDSEAPLTQWTHSTVRPGDTLNNLNNGQLTFFRLQALNAGGFSTPTAPVSATPQPNPPATPTGLTVIPGEGELSINWHTLPELNYTLYWSDDLAIAPRDSGNTLINARPTYRHTGLRNTTPYRYQISARNSGGESALSEPVQGIIPGLPPAQPQSIQGSTIARQNTLQWQAVTDAEQYTVQWSIQADMNELQSALVNAPPFVHTVSSTTLYYRVIAHNDNGDSPPSVIVSIVQDSPNQAPQITRSAPITVSMDEDSSPTAFVLTLTATDNESDPLNWSIATPAGRGVARIAGNNTSAIVFYVPETDVNGSDVFTVQVSDGQGGTDILRIEVSITPQNDAPTITNTNFSLSVVENTSAVTAIMVTDIDSTTFTYTLSGTDSGLFSMSGNTLGFTAAPDFDAPQDSGADNVYNVTVIANDSTDSSAATAFAITVTDANDTAPVITNTNLSPSIEENTTAVIAITVTDIDSATFTYTLSGADSNLFRMSRNTLSFTAAPDFDVPQDSGGDNIYNVTVVASDGTNNSAATAFAITVTDANDTAPVITNTDLSPSIKENTTAVTVITVTDIDSITFTYTLSGTDSGLFSMTENNLHFTAAPDFDAPQDSDADNVYNVTVIANDGTNDSATKAFVITVTDANDTAPVITNTDLSLSIAENTTTVTAITVTDIDSTTFTYTLSGADSDLFRMSGNTLSFTTAPDFDAPQDSGADNVYNVIVIANDGTNDSAPAEIILTLTDVNDEAPVISNAATLSVKEQTTAVTIIAATDADSNVFTYRIAGGADRAFFNLSGANLVFADPPDFLNPLDVDSDNVYRVAVIVNDGVNDSAALSFSISVTGVGEPRWQEEEAIGNENARSISNPQIAVNAKGNAVAVWSQNDGELDNIWANHYEVGSGWGNAELIEISDEGNAAQPQIVVDVEGNAHAVWSQTVDRRSNIWANRYVVDSGWGSAELIQTDNMETANSPQITLNSEGNAFVIWRQNDGTRYNIWANRYVAGSGWNRAELIELEDAGDASMPRIALDTQGNAFAVWSQFSDTGSNIWANRYMVDSGWGSAVLIEDENKGDASQPQIVVDDNSGALVVWTQSNDSRRDIRANRYVVGSGWGNAELIETDNKGNAVQPQIAMNGKGNAMAVWSQSDGTSTNIWANRYVAGSGWGAAEIVEAISLDVIVPQVVLDANGNALAVWVRIASTPRRRTIWANRYVVGSGWGSVERIEADSRWLAGAPQISLGANGNALAVWPRADGSSRNRLNIWVNRFE